MKTIVLSIINRIKKIVYLASPQGEWVAYSAPPNHGSMNHGDTEATEVSRGKNHAELLNHGDTGTQRSTEKIY